MTAIGTRSVGVSFLHFDDQPACAGADPGMFFDEDSAEAAQVADLLYCQRCPVRARCEAWAMAQPPYSLHGIWAGQSHPQRLAAHGHQTRRNGHPVTA
ncbi:WhiB family transcriptional regulator [Micromonospora fluostatini]|uniref:WhiB family transcriptional regulator n=1 Tax=Micromonospora fluostatini TaxID=1629071 RepID=A0ABY2DGS7_9ACTN|nr:WhiB family transcriptional regulator [Micromonospora fluostatini]